MSPDRWPLRWLAASSWVSSCKPGYTSFGKFWIERALRGKERRYEYWQTVEEALGIMGKGMLGIFVVIIIIALLVYGLTKITSKKKS